jgi:8-oxo-dGTP diphosphatase
MSSDVVVTAAVVERDGRLLVTRRAEGTHLAGKWEFPGGKCEPGESHEACLAREIREELATEVRVIRRLLQTRHAYPERTVELHFFACELVGDPVPQLGQEMRWVDRKALDPSQFPAADAELIERMRG